MIWPPATTGMPGRTALTSTCSTGGMDRKYCLIIQFGSRPSRSATAMPAPAVDGCSSRVRCTCSRRTWAGWGVTYSGSPGELTLTHAKDDAALIIDMAHPLRKSRNLLAASQVT
jgi:hypothetical protein